MQQKINETCALIAHLQSSALISANEEITKISKKDGQRKIFRCSKEMNRIWSSYNDYMDNLVGNISSMIIDFCVEHRINLLIIGYNEGWKQEIELGKKTNRVFCHMPHGRLVKTLEYKAKEKGLSFMTVEESYTSKCDHLALEDMCHHDKYLGKRAKRGMFKSSTGKIVHADVNGCIGMIRKSKVIPDAVLADGLRNRGDVVSPVVLNVRGFAPHKQRSPKNLKRSLLY
jgi:IS605 OrfB family transposase